MTAPVAAPRLRMSRWLWARLIRDLRARGQGRRESGAFLLAEQADASRIAAYVLYDDLDGECLTGGISFASSGYTLLWGLCREHHMTVVADAHTHPGRWVDQSGIDQQHPMVPRAGHLAVIVPNFAGSRDVRRCGLHVYQGAHHWVSLDEASARDALSLTFLPFGGHALRPGVTADGTPRGGAA